MVFFVVRKNKSTKFCVLYDLETKSRFDGSPSCHIWAIERSKGFGYTFPDMKRHISKQKPIIRLTCFNQSFPFEYNGFNRDLMVVDKDTTETILKIDKEIKELEKLKQEILRDESKYWDYITLNQAIEVLKPNEETIRRIEKVKKQISGEDKSVRDDTRRLEK